MRIRAVVEGRVQGAGFRYFNRDGTDRRTHAELVRGLIKCYPCPG